jgi:hypothetical protein
MKQARRPQGQQATLEGVIRSNDNFTLATGSQFECAARDTAHEIDKIQRRHRCPILYNAKTHPAYFEVGFVRAV